jgi:hypothetical protein
MTNRYIVHTSIGRNEPKYVREYCEYQVDRYIQDLKLTDILTIETSDYIYPISIRVIDCYLMDYKKVVFSFPVKPTKDIRIKLIINR